MDLILPLGVLLGIAGYVLLKTSSVEFVLTPAGHRSEENKMTDGVAYYRKIYQ